MKTAHNFSVFRELLSRFIALTAALYVLALVIGACGFELYLLFKGTGLHGLASPNIFVTLFGLWMVSVCLAMYGGMLFWVPGIITAGGIAALMLSPLWRRPYLLTVLSVILAFTFFKGWSYIFKHESSSIRDLTSFAVILAPIGFGVASTLLEHCRRRTGRLLSVK